VVDPRALDELIPTGACAIARGGAGGDNRHWFLTAGKFPCRTG
jgi:hypothetical protein